MTQAPNPPSTSFNPTGLKSWFDRGVETAIGDGKYNEILGDKNYGLFPWEDSAKVHGESDTKRASGHATIPEKLAYGAGRVAGVGASDKARSWFWRYNHPLAIASSLGSRIPEVVNRSPVKTGNLRVPSVLAGFAVAQALDLGSGNTNLFNLGEAGRPAGYAAALPEWDDPTKSQNVAIELPFGYITGRKGKLLPWGQFTQERPDVSMEDYQRYSEYNSFNTPGLFGLEKANPIATTAIGAALGATKGYLSKPHIAIANPRTPGQNALVGAGLGAVAGALTPTLADLVSRTGLLKGTWENLDNQPEAQLLGYKVTVPGLLAAGSVAGAFGIHNYLLGEKAKREYQLNNREVFEGPPQPPKGRVDSLSDPDKYYQAQSPDMKGKMSLVLHSDPEGRIRSGLDPYEDPIEVAETKKIIEEMRDDINAGKGKPWKNPKKNKGRNKGRERLHWDES